ncbi:MAG TPA: oligopeptide/dipeptide ABC transporter ATP-binding protein [Chloroflexota bacterium]|jgi:oligopeptide/dipeptide ABC transporter ATP-binding protein
MEPSSPLVEARDLTKRFKVPTGTLLAVDHVSFRIEPGEVVGLVGESGSGKSTLARLLLRLIPLTEGTIRFEGRPLLQSRGRELQEIRRRMQIVFQDPFSSFDPRMTVGQSVAEGLYFLPRSRRGARVTELLELVGLSPDQKDRYPHEFSGGQRQRLAIARALGPGPRFVIADEPVSALDISIQAQMLNLFRDLQRRLGLTYLFVGHDLAVVHHIADRVMVMYRGRVVEEAEKTALFARPHHPYTQLLLASAVEVVGLSGKTGAGGSGPEGNQDTRGCAFAPRCPLADSGCREAPPPLREVGAGHRAACFKAEQAAAHG